MHNATSFLVCIRDDNQLKKKRRVPKLLYSEVFSKLKNIPFCAMVDMLPVQENEYMQSKTTNLYSFHLLLNFRDLSTSIPHFFSCRGTHKQFFMWTQSQELDIRILSLGILQKTRSRSRKGQCTKLIDSPIFVNQVFSIFKIITSKQYVQMKQINILTLLIQNIIQKIDQTQLIEPFLNFLVSQYTALIQQKKYKTITPIISITIACLFTLKYYPNRQINKQKLIFEMIDLHLTTFGVQVDGLILLEAAIVCYPQFFSAYLDKYWSLLEKNILQGKYETKVFQLALQNIGTIARKFRQNTELNYKISQMLKLLTSILKKEINLQSKFEIIRCLSDFGAILQKIEDTMTDMIQSIVSRQFTNFQHYKSNKKCFILYEQILYLYHSWMFNLKENNLISQQNLHQIYEFVLKTTNEIYNPPQAYLIQVVMLLFDLQILLENRSRQGKQLVSLLLSPQIKNIIFQISLQNADSYRVKSVLDFVNSRKKSFQKPNRK